MWQKFFLLTLLISVGNASDYELCIEGFQCGNGSCFPISWKCDGENDCDDGSDEQGCDFKACNDSKFKCNNGNCIPLTLKCNGENNCGDSSDEQDCGDLNECLTDGICSHQCTNSFGSYNCSCLNGYEPDNANCYAIEPDPLLIYASLNRITGFNIRTKKSFLIHKAVAKAFSVSSDSLESKVYWLDASYSFKAGRSFDYHVSVYTSKIDGADFKVVLNRGLLVPESIDVDYIGRNLYLTDSYLKSILVCKMDGKICNILHGENLQKPRAIKVDPLEGLMYWSDWGDSPGIYLSGMDGSNPTILVSKNIKYPNGIAVDYTTKRLFWVDAGLKTIESITLDGQSRKVIADQEKIGLVHPYSVSVFENRLYWTDWITLTLKSIDKFSGNDVEAIAYEGRNYLMGTDFHHPVLAKEANNPCLQNNCSHMCIIAPRDQFRCVCPTGYILSDDECTCSEDETFPVLFISDESRIIQMRPGAVGDSALVEWPDLHLNKLGKLAFDWKSKTLFVIEKLPPTIFAINMTSLIKRPLVTQGITTPEDIAFDWMGENVYWVDSSRGTVEVISPRTFLSTVIIYNLIKPISIVLVPQEGRMFITCLGGESSVLVYSMDGWKEFVLPLIKNPPLALAVHPSSSFLTWVDQDDGKIAYLDYLDPYKEPVIVEDRVEGVTTIAVTEKFLYWTEAKNSSLYILPHQPREEMIFKFPLLETEKMSTKCLYYFNPAILASAGQSLCMLNNGGCSHLCVTTATLPRCLCPAGMHLLDDMISCANSNIVEDSFATDDITTARIIQTTEASVAGIMETEHMNCENGTDESYDATVFLCKSGLYIPIVWRCNGENDCNDRSDEENCNATVCNEMTQIRCNNGQCIPKEFLCDGFCDCFDRSDELYCDSSVVTESLTTDDSGMPTVEAPDFICAEGWIDCKNGKCVSSIWKCDEDNDCGNNVDEENCEWNTSFESAISENFAHVTTIPPTEISANGSCKDGPCSYLCLMTSQGICVCPPGLSDDGKMCSILMLLVYDDSRVYSLIPESGRISELIEIPDFNIDMISRLAYDWKSRTYFVLDKKNVALYSVNMNTLRKRELVHNSLDTPEDLAFDWVSDNLYWVDSAKGSIEVISPVSYRNVILITDLIKPTGIALVPKLGIMFVSTTGEKASIYKFHMDGRNRLKVADVTESTVSIAVHSSSNLLFWADSQTGEISYMDYMALEGQPRLMESRIENVVSIAVSDNYLHWTDTESHLLHSMFLNETVSFPIILPSLENQTFHRRILYTESAVAAQSIDVFPCSMNNGGCSYLCLTTKTGRSCACPAGLELLKDNFTCANVELKSSIIKSLLSKNLH